MSILFRNRVHRFANKVYETAHSIIVEGLFVPKRRNILIVLENEEGKFLQAAHNLVTDAGDQFYAEKAAGQTPTNNFANLYLSTVPWDTGHPAKNSTTDNLASVIAGSEKAPTAGYPTTNDTDSDNSGAGVDVVTWAYSYAKADFSDPDVEAGAIAVASVTSWGTATGTDPVMTAFNISPAFGKTTNDTLKFFVNHTFNGA